MNSTTRSDDMSDSVESEVIERAAGVLFSLEDVKTIVCADLQRQKKIVNVGKFTKNCNRAINFIRQAKNISQVMRVLEAFKLSPYLYNASRFMISTIAKDEACPHMYALVLMEAGKIKQVKCKQCGVAIEYIVQDYVPEGPEGTIVGTFSN